MADTAPRREPVWQACWWRLPGAVTYVPLIRPTHPLTCQHPVKILPQEICETWKLRTPNEWEPIQWWSQLLSWRNQVGQQRSPGGRQCHARLGANRWTNDCLCGEMQIPDGALLLPAAPR